MMSDTIPAQCRPIRYCETCKLPSSKCLCDLVHQKLEGILACHESILCSRCGNCLRHCECGPAQTLIQRRAKLRRGEVHEDQIPLCEKPDLHY